MSRKAWTKTITYPTDSSRIWMIEDEPKKEVGINERITSWMKFHEPEIYFEMDPDKIQKVPAGMTKNQAARYMNKIKIGNEKRGFISGRPDCKVYDPGWRNWNGLIMEFKRVDKYPFTKGSTPRLLKDDHLTRQARAMGMLCSRGYVACFTGGWEHTLQVLKWYLYGSGNPLITIMQISKNDDNERYLGVKEYYQYMKIDF